LKPKIKQIQMAYSLIQLKKILSKMEVASQMNSNLL